MMRVMLMAVLVGDEMEARLGPLSRCPARRYNYAEALLLHDDRDRDGG
jgi:hypothetical protein